MDLGVPKPGGLNELLCGKPVELTREKVESELVSHGSGLRLLLASENSPRRPPDQSGRKLPGTCNSHGQPGSFRGPRPGSRPAAFRRESPALCTDRIVVVEGSPNVIAQSKTLLEAIVGLHIDPAAISVVLNNRIRTDAQMPGRKSSRRSVIRSRPPSRLRLRCSQRPPACTLPRSSISRTTSPRSKYLSSQISFWNTKK